jgi:YhcH/YjgK/YiaL family protein
MIIDRIENWQKNSLVNEQFKKAFEFIEHHVSATIKDGTYEIQGKEIYAIVQSYKTVPREEKRFESHSAYIDLQYVVSGKETIEWAPIKILKIAAEYNQEKDVVFYNRSNDSTSLKMFPGTFAVFFPEDGHIPGCVLDTQTKVKKVVIKIMRKGTKNEQQEN